MEETLISASQYSVFQSQEQEQEQEGDCSSEDLFSSQELASSLPVLPPSQQPSTSQPNPSSKDALRQARNKRLKEARATFKSWAEQEGCTTAQLAGLFIHLDCYSSDRATAKLGMALYNGERTSDKPQVSVPEAIWIRERLQLSSARYLELRLRLHDRIVLPAEYLVSAQCKIMRPANMEPFHHGFLAPLNECLGITLGEILGGLQDQDSIPPSVEFRIVYGLDGSGQHSDYAQMSKTSYSTAGIINASFSITGIRGQAPPQTDLWTSPAHNAAASIRPWALFDSKENDDLLRALVPKLEQQIQQVTQSGLSIRLPGNRIIKASLVQAKMTMVDGKTIVRVLQLGGSYCTMCDHTLEQCHNSPFIANGFAINRSLEKIQDLAITLAEPNPDPESDEVGIRVRPRDYETRTGITGFPIAGSADLTRVIPACHAKIHTAHWFLNGLIVRQNSHKKWCYLSRRVRYEAGEKEQERIQRDVLQRKIKEQLGFNIGDASDMLTGNRFHTFASDDAREKLAGMIHDSTVRESFKEIHLGFCAIVRVLESQQGTIDVPKFKMLCTETHLKIVETFPWAVLSPSLHRVLAHSWEVIEANNSKGLGSESEEGLEAANKYIRQFRSHGARKTSTEDNFRDTFNHLWHRSSPLVAHLDREKRKRATKIIVSGEVDTLVDSLFL